MISELLHKYALRGQSFIQGQVNIGEGMNTFLTGFEGYEIFSRKVQEKVKTMTCKSILSIECITLFAL